VTSGQKIPRVIYPTRRSGLVKRNVETMDNLFPVNLNLRGRKCLVVGGGRVAERKVKSLLQCGAEIWIVSPEFTSGLERLSGQSNINLIHRHYDTEDLQNCFLVISAADDPSVNSRVADDCFARNIPVNVVDDPARCSFTVPSVLRRGSLCIAVSTEGNSPLLARKIREEMENSFGSEYARFLELMGEVRGKVIRYIPDIEARRRIFEYLINSDILELMRRSEALRSMSKVQNEEELNPKLAALNELIEKRIMQCMSLTDHL
jgi:precorrin-2 dehydrogenase/sirohydrochlorin ferrochelatase